MSDSLITGLRALLRERWDDPEADVLAVDPFGDGHSGFTYLADLRTATASGQYVLRLSPPGARIAANADVGRQGRIIAAMHAAGVPTPAVLLADSGGVVDGRSIMITERVSGVDCPTAASAHGAAWVVDAAVSALHSVHAVPVDAVGLPGERPQPAGDDVTRWSRLLDRAPEELHEDGYRLRDALLDALPAPVPPALVHGDYHYGNLLFGPDGVAAVLDWEVAGLGDPRWDFGSLAVTALRHKYRPEPNVTGDLDISVADLAGRFDGTPDLAWFAAAACFKYTAILGYNRGLHLKGKRPDPVYDQLLGTISGLAGDGMAILAGGIA